MISSQAWPTISEHLVLATLPAGGSATAWGLCEPAGDWHLPSSSPARTAGLLHTSTREALIPSGAGAMSCHSGVCCAGALQGMRTGRTGRTGRWAEGAGAEMQPCAGSQKWGQGRGYRAGGRQPHRGYVPRGCALGQVRKRESWSVFCPGLYLVLLRI